MRIVAVIPARMASSRYPGKPLAPIRGLSMIEHVRRRTARCPALERVIVATCDQAIMEEVQRFGGEAVMTSDCHERCTDRVAEAVSRIPGLGMDDVVVNVQGDMPLVRPEMLTALVEPFFHDPALLCCDLVSPLRSEEEYHSAHVVKVVGNLAGNALYYSREAIPSLKKAPGSGLSGKNKQLGIIAFRRHFLETFSALSPTPLEALESVDMMRPVEHGYPVRLVVTPYATVGVDTPADLGRAEALMLQDDLFPLYADSGRG
ncbi:MAG: 3-deoxy-manno-octulosonate cytidylyltransferase [Magnetococcales bacterium]|nr:3-deoxy-manno-octulosonate cytidylyltransferase [Magnetococcales bacterium]